MAADRAYIAGGRVGETRAALAALTARIMGLFEAAGCMRVEPAALHPADALLDVYGEDLRARAFTVEGPEGGELFLRPDFTAPVFQLHMAARAEPARYCYLGPVWRRQPPGSGRPREYLQAGLEVFGEDAAEADAACFALARDALAEGGVTRRASSPAISASSSPCSTPSRCPPAAAPRSSAISGARAAFTTF
jgi:ATP phosphoribosyltransferase regulatory subunit